MKNKKCTFNTKSRPKNGVKNPPHAHQNRVSAKRQKTGAADELSITFFHVNKGPDRMEIFADKARQILSFQIPVAA